MEQRITAPNGFKIESVEHDDNSVVIMFSEDKPKFKRGDFLICITSEITVIFEELESAQGKTFETFYNNSGYSNVNWSLGMDIALKKRLSWKSLGINFKKN